jgi:DNA-directed RNA polymerase alpha subunit
MNDRALMQMSLEYLIEFGMGEMPTAKALRERLAQPELAIATPKAKKGLQLKAQINKLEITARTVHCLNLEGINTVGQLVEHTAKELLRTQNIGRKSLNEIKKALELKGMSLKG